MTKDSICKNCKHLVKVAVSLTTIGKLPKTQTMIKSTKDFVHRWCRISAINEDDLNPDIHQLQVLHCSEFRLKKKEQSHSKT